ncbi:MAG: Fic family protein [Puniceicoccales bacterium]|jgi:Fic family protein|nr:Fic family protein [Puniceicoccales bacterium]
MEDSDAAPPENLFRTGRHLKQTAGHRAFIPAPLPPVPPVEISTRTQQLLSQADLNLGRLDGSIQTLPNPDLFVFMYVKKEAVLSSQIEGTQSSLNDLLAAEANLLSARNPQDTDEVINYINAMNHGLSRLRDLPFSLRLIREIHAVLLKNGRGTHMTPGEFRRSQNWIGPAGCSLANATFVPPPPGEIDRAMGNVETFWHSNLPLPALVKIALIHAQFETIHPFLDGNGRMGRLLITFFLCEQNILQKPVLYLSHYFKKNRDAYYTQLQSVRDTGNWEQWVEFFLHGIIEVSRQATATARAILDLREKHRALIPKHLTRIASNAYQVLDLLYAHPIITIRDTCKTLGITYNAAGKIIQNFLKLGILRELTGYRRNRVFFHEPYIRLFDETSPAQNEKNECPE